MTNTELHECAAAGHGADALVSLLQQMRLPMLLKLKQYKLAEVLPRLNSRRGRAVAQSNIRTIVPFWLAVASLLPSWDSARAASWLSCAATRAVLRWLNSSMRTWSGVNNGECAGAAGEAVAHHLALVGAGARHDRIFGTDAQAAQAAGIGSGVDLEDQL